MRGEHQVAATQIRASEPPSGGGPTTAQTTCPTENAAEPRELAFALATEARQAALLTALHRMRHVLTLHRLHVLLRGEHGEQLAGITVQQLSHATPRRSIWRDRSRSLEHAVMHVFRSHPAKWFSSGFFIRHVGLERWTAQKLLARLADQGWLLRSGTTSGTRYRLAAQTPR